MHQGRGCYNLASSRGNSLYKRIRVGTEWWVEGRETRGHSPPGRSGGLSPGVAGPVE
ncbi:hypothetical protein PABY_16120 [Pyrodictium abyssi]|uniref:Uncharacterized protein n=1 Tax=Pyrodictium abyssi TaxID=54256 RepID=A0ABM8IWY4_9CREN|nr:hypothetical protein PABY_16120 [Pyrodictium abyssi]